MLDMISTAFRQDDPPARSDGIDASEFRELIAGMIETCYPLNWNAVGTDSKEWDLPKRC